MDDETFIGLMFAVQLVIATVYQECQSSAMPGIEHKAAGISHSASTSACSPCCHRGVSHSYVEFLPEASDELYEVLGLFLFYVFILAAFAKITANGFLA